MKWPEQQDEDPELNVAPLIDLVFLLLVYFMVTASLVRSEADLGIKLPGMLAQAEAVEMVDEQMIEVMPDGRVLLNGRAFDRPNDPYMPELVGTLIRYRLSAESAGSPPFVTIWAEDDTRHQRVIDVLNACAEAGITQVSFARVDD